MDISIENESKLVRCNTLKILIEFHTSLLENERKLGWGSPAKNPSLGSTARKRIAFYSISIGQFSPNSIENGRKLCWGSQAKNLILGGTAQTLIDFNSISMENERELGCGSSGQDLIIFRS